MEQRRHFSRVLFSASATLDHEGQQTVCEVSDLSLKGALLRPPADVKLPAGVKCRLTLHLGNDGDQTIRMEGLIAHHHSTLLGLHCTSIDLDSITHLRRLVELNRGDETDLQRELSALTAE